MAKEIDKVGIPVSIICTITPIAETVGANRIVRAVAVPYPVGNPTVAQEDERAIRNDVLQKSLSALETQITQSITL